MSTLLIEATAVTVRKPQSSCHGMLLPQSVLPFFVIPLVTCNSYDMNEKVHARLNINLASPCWTVLVEVTRIAVYVLVPVASFHSQLCSFGFLCSQT